MNHAIISTVLVALAAIATALPIDSRQPPCWIFSIATRQYVKLSDNGEVTANGHPNDAAVHVHSIPNTTPPQIRIEAAKSTSDNVCYLTFYDGQFKSGTPLNGNEVFERVQVTPGVYALRVVNPVQVSSGSGSGSAETEEETTDNTEEKTTDYFLGFSSETFEAGIYDSQDFVETKFIFLPNHE